MRPPKSILDRSFAWTSSARTDLRKTFARIRRELRIAEQLRAANEVEAKTKTVPIPQRKSA